MMGLIAGLVVFGCTAAGLTWAHDRALRRRALEATARRALLGRVAGLATTEEERAALAWCRGGDGWR